MKIKCIRTNATKLIIYMKRELLQYYLSTHSEGVRLDIY